MICDLCNAPVTAADGTRVPGLEMRSAVLRGFNPFTTPGFDPAGASALRMLGVSVDGAATDWRNRALNDATDWMLCLSCYETFKQRFGSTSGGLR